MGGGKINLPPGKPDHLDNQGKEEGDQDEEEQPNSSDSGSEDSRNRGGLTTRSEDRFKDRNGVGRRSLSIGNA